MFDVILSKAKQKRYIDKIENTVEALEKLQELIDISGVNIEFDYKNRKCYLIKNTENNDSKKVEMHDVSRNMARTYLIETENGSVGLNFAETYTIFNYSIEMNIFVEEDNNTRVYMFKQGNIWGRDDVPFFMYIDFKDNVLHYFGSNGHLVEFITSNTQMHVLENVLNIYGKSNLFNQKGNIDYKQLVFGAYHDDTYRFRPDGTRIYRFIPTVDLEYIKNNKSLKRKLIMNIGPVIICEETKHISYSKKDPDNILFPNHKDIFHKSFAHENYDEWSFEKTNPKCLEYSVEVLKSKEAYEAYKAWHEYFDSLPIMDYINDYYGHMLEGVEFYQKYPDEKYYTNYNGGRIIKARPSLFKPHTNKIGKKETKILGLTTNKVD